MCPSARRCRTGSIWCWPTLLNGLITTRSCGEKILRSALLVFCGRRSDATTAAQIGLAQKYGHIVTDLDGLRVAVGAGRDSPLLRATCWQVLQA